MSEYKKITANSGLISLGNTGARLGDPRAVYANVLNTLVEFRKHNKNWNKPDQVEFGKFLGKHEIFNIKTDNKVSSDKDVRLKTGFIYQFGFTTKSRIVSRVGAELLANSKISDINEFEISKESGIYLKQFLKYQQGDFQIIPLLSLIYSCIEFNNELPIDFVTYVWAGSRYEKELKENISLYKKGVECKRIIFQSVVNSKNTEIAKTNTTRFFSTNNISNKKEFLLLLNSILPHPKGDSFKKKTIVFFYDLFLYWQNKNKWDETKKKNFIQEKLKSRYKDINSKKSTDYLETLFGISSLNNSADWKRIIPFFENTFFMSSIDESSFIVNFHLLYMYIKKLSLCEEYIDLNTRHLKLLDIFVFEYGKLKLDLVFWYLFKSVKDDLLKVKPLPQNEYRVKLEASQNDIGDIYDFLKINVAELSKQIATDFPEVKKLGLQNFALKKKEERLLELVNTVFTKENIIKIFENIYPRKDDQIRKLIKEWYQDYEATIPALFEYLLGISFYWLSERQVRISNILNLGLDANLLPKTHTAGGQADIVVRCKDKDYLIEATLSDNDGQRKMEAEPVPRHLAKHILEVNPNSLALFVAGQLDPNNLVVLRNYKFSSWYNSDGNSVETMSILPLSVSNMICLLKNENDFNKLENKFETLLNSETKDGFKWYTNEVNTAFVNGN